MDTGNNRTIIAGEGIPIKGVDRIDATITEPLHQMTEEEIEQYYAQYRPHVVTMEIPQQPCPCCQQMLQSLKDLESQVNKMKEEHRNFVLKYLHDHDPNEEQVTCPHGIRMGSDCLGFREICPDCCYISAKMMNNAKVVTP
jgi:hypothetical protein